MRTFSVARPARDRVVGSLAFGLCGLLLGTALVRYARAVDGGGPLLDLLTVLGVWSFLAVLVVVAAVPTASRRDPRYSVLLAGGFAAGSTYAAGWPYAMSTPGVTERLQAALFVGLVGALLVGLPAVGLGLLWRRLRGRLRAVGE